jgi:plasmid stability protein
VSMAAKARRILRAALAPEAEPPARHLYDGVRARFARLGGVALPLPPRDRVPPRFAQRGFRTRI